MEIMRTKSGCARNQKWLPLGLPRWSAVGLLALAFGALPACGSGDGTRDGTQYETRVNGTLVHRYDVTPEHFVEFYDIGDSYLISEEFPVGNDSLVAPLDSSLSISQFFRALRPGVAVPFELEQAALRIAAVDKELQDRAANDPTLASSVIDPLTGEALEVEGAARATTSDLGAPDRAGTGDVSTRALGCSADLLNDSWGAQWFKDNHCPAFFSGCGRDCGALNRWDVVRHYANSNSLLWVQMEGDFNLAGEMHGTRTGFPNPTPVWVWDKVVPPNTVVVHRRGSGGSGTMHAYGSSPCGHAHVGLQLCPW
jgi:hypothetical protein